MVDTVPTTQASSKETAHLDDDKTTSNLVASDTQASITREEYQGLMDTLREFKQQLVASKEGQTNFYKKPSIDEQVAREIASNERRELTQKELADKAKFISEVSKLAEENLASHFNTEKLELQGYHTDEIVDAQIKALVKKYVPQETIIAIAGTSDLEKVKKGSELLGQLFRVAKAHIRDRQNRYNSQRALNSILTRSENSEFKSFSNDGANLLAEDDFKYANLNYWKQRRENREKQVS
ncbi:hypothetical protein DB313_05725 (plasmid) [Borrelia turcica IST7]|uniref:Uncharacterized protein n=1 Tax=Borrelia turcica IST7 TaxID=1104446 RepID=A0A386PP97_9SPIR|nr:DUF1357 family protein [Borrelia turcica]AYE36998.1 hypothetical protein DB313_05725 [Borrelia turcica IST7]